MGDRSTTQLFTGTYREHRIVVTPARRGKGGQKASGQDNTPDEAPPPKPPATSQTCPNRMVFSKGEWANAFLPDLRNTSTVSGLDRGAPIG